MTRLHDALGGLREIPQWIVWNLKWDSEENKFEKWPAAGDASKPSAWLTYADAVAMVASRPARTAALGFWLTAQCGYFFLDIDNAASNGAWSPFALELVAQFPGALVEVSSSGRGLHVIGKTRAPMLPHSSRGTDGLELYSHARGICFGLTGGAQGSADTFHDYAVRALIAERFPPIERKESAGPDPRWRGPADDDALIDVMLRSRQSAQAAFGGKPSFKQLWEGKAEKNSENDMALLSRLAFWTGNDWERMVRLARRSGMVRDKWSDHRTYLAETARKAANCATVYQERSTFVPPKIRSDVSSVDELMRAEFRPVQWAIRNVLPEGVTIFSAAPKMGKSWLVLQWCMAVAGGAPVWGGREPEEAGEALYLSLEDNPRRLQRRVGTLMKVFPKGMSLARLHFSTEWPKAEAGVEKIAEWLRQHPGCRLVVIDTVAAFRESDPGRRSAYAFDYEVGAQLKPLAKEFQCAIVLVAHNRKMASNDVMQQVSGTTGLTGSVDNVLMLERLRGSKEAALHVDGRDIEEPSRLALSHDGGPWRFLGNADDVTRTRERTEIRQALIALKGAGTAKEIHEALGGTLSLNAVRLRLSRMARGGELNNAEGLYTLKISTPDLPPMPPLDVVT